MHAAEKPGSERGSALSRESARAANCGMGGTLSRNTRTGRSFAGSPIFQELELERSRLARELHAGAGQPLAAIKLHLTILDNLSEGLPPPARDVIRRLHLLADSALSEVRSVSHRLHSPNWQMMTTSQALRQMLREAGAEVCFAETALQIEELAPEPSHHVKIAIYRCAQECVTNVMRHSGASRLSVVLASRGDWVELKVEDNGKGIESAPSAGGMGLRAIHAHAAAVGGDCAITSGAWGTSISFRLPISSEAAG
jgi:signal transduction histidine kinase